MTDTLVYLANLIASVPTTFWAVVAGSFFTLGGVYLTNRANDRRLGRQLESDRKLRKDERELAVRKDIYLSVAEAIAAGLNTVVRFTDLSIPENQVTALYVERAPAIAKAHLVAKEPTIRAVVEFASALEVALLRLSTVRIPLITLQQQIAQKASDIAAFARVRDSMIDLMRQHNIEGASDQRRFSAIQDNYNFEAARVAEVAAEHFTLAKELRRQHLAYIEICHDESKRVAAYVPAALISAREEMELPIDQGAYLSIIQDAQQKVDDEMKEFLKRLA